MGSLPNLNELTTERLERRLEERERILARERIIERDFARDKDVARSSDRPVFVHQQQVGFACWVNLRGIHYIFFNAFIILLSLASD